MKARAGGLDEPASRWGGGGEEAAQVALGCLAFLRSGYRLAPGNFLFAGQVFQIPALEAVQVLAIHVSVQIQVPFTLGASFELYHRQPTSLTGLEAHY